MPAFAEKHRWQFPYLVDESQAVALAYGAACTPDFFLFDEKLRLFYTGQFDHSRPRSNQSADGADMLAAARLMLAQQVEERLLGEVSRSCRPSLPRLPLQILQDPAAIVTGPDASRAVPFSVISRDAALVDRFGRSRFDYLVHNAGVGVHAPLVDTTTAQFDALVLGLPWQRLGDGGVIIVI